MSENKVVVTLDTNTVIAILEEGGYSNPSIATVQNAKKILEQAVQATWMEQIESEAEYIFNDMDAEGVKFQSEGDLVECKKTRIEEGDSGNKVELFTKGELYPVMYDEKGRPFTHTNQGHDHHLNTHTEGFKQGFEEIYSNKKSYAEIPKVLGYYIHKDDKEMNANNVMVVIDERFSTNADLTCYCPVGQHGGMTSEYLGDCRTITKEEYLEASNIFYTPKEYL